MIHFSLSGGGFLTAPERQALRWVIHRKADAGQIAAHEVSGKHPISVRRLSERLYDINFRATRIRDGDQNTWVMSDPTYVRQGWLVREAISEFVAMGLVLSEPDYNDSETCWRIFTEVVGAAQQAGQEEARELSSNQDDAPSPRPAVGKNGDAAAGTNA